MPSPPGQASLDVTRSQKEPEERRVMRTLAESLSAVVSNVVQSTNVSSGVVHSLIPAGVSREQLVALRDVLSAPAVTQFTAAFDWSPAYRAPAGMSEPIVVPATAVERIDDAARFMTNQRGPRAETFTGPVIEIRQVPGTSIGSLTLQTIRRGRPAEVRVAADAPTVDQAHDWMRRGETVITVGAIGSAPGRPLEIPSPDAIYALSEGMLPSP